MNRLLITLSLVAMMLPAKAQQTLSLDSCLSLAMSNNKQLGAARIAQTVAENTRKAARTKYLPHIDAMAGYEWMSKEISILSNENKTMLGNIGSLSGMFDPQTAAVVDAMGKKLADETRTDTRNIFMGSVMLTQPVFMGGAIIAANKIADINETMAENSAEATRQGIVNSVEQTYWTVVSLKHKQQLADNYLKLVQKLDGDVQKMIGEGVATRADGLKVSVKVNEAEMQLTQVNNGLTLAKMLLCQMCGLPSDTAITLDDEDKQAYRNTAADAPIADDDNNTGMRPELKMLQNAIDISRQTTRLMRAANLPQVALTAGYLITNPNIYDGFEKKFAGVWNVGVMVRVPVWNWFENAYKVRASKAATTMAMLQRSDMQEKIDLQVCQSRFKVKEAAKRLAMADKNVERAEENMRCANLGFSEGVMQTTDVMEAQTAWLQAKTQKVDAEIDIRLARTELKKALGRL